MFKLSVGQANFQVTSTGVNLKLVQELCGEADVAGTAALVLPELANSGYTFNSREEAAASAEIVDKGPLCRLLRDWSRPGRLVVSGLCERDGDVLYNSAVVYADGQLVLVYRKLHLFAREALWFHPGTEPAPIVEFRGHCLGVMICFDWVFPEMARSLALRGAQVILHPANLVLPYCQDAMVTRSIENRVFTATANRCGQDRELSFSGLSQITAPNGARLVQAGADFHGIVSADIDPCQADDKWITPHNHLFEDRRPDMYR
ncbi:MAG TPA: nitrilase-related carbon-nitrogen hydrolase [Anaerolineaceae bacterium]|jgi:predicted amidohydrolase|nr:nitrilase-related carbon-nitrogen hydrolase [Anaerolineaceae bacterium]